MRVYERKFDWGEASRLRKQGLTYKAIGDRLGVTGKAIYWAVNPAAYRTAGARATEWQKNGTCPECGGRATRNATTGQHSCRRCSSIKQASSARDDELRCVTCREWKPDQAFPSNVAEKYGRRGRARQCGACNTRARQDYRERHKVPCRECGALCLPQSEKRTTGVGFPRCRSCANRASALSATKGTVS